MAASKNCDKDWHQGLINLVLVVSVLTRVVMSGFVTSRHHDTVNKQRLILTPATTRYSWQEDGWWCWPWQWSCWRGLCWWVQLSVRSHSSQQYFRRDWFVKIISSTPDGGRLIISSSSSSGLLFICLSCGSLTEEHFYDPIFTHNWSRLLHHQTFYISSSTAELSWGRQWSYIGYQTSNSALSVA